MDLLQQAAAAYAALMQTEYYITVGKNGELTSYVLRFNEYNFKHVSGIHKLTDLEEIKRASSKKIFDDITAAKPRLTLSDIQASKMYPNIENRLHNLTHLEYYLDNASCLYKWDINRSPVSKINADIMIPCKSKVNTKETAYAFFEKDKDNILRLVDYVTDTAYIENTVTLISDKRDYTRGQLRPPTVLYKAKINKDTDKRTIFIDRLTDKKPIMTHEKRNDCLADNIFVTHDSSDNTDDETDNDDEKTNVAIKSSRFDNIINQKVCDESYAAPTNHFGDIEYD